VKAREVSDRSQRLGTSCSQPPCSPRTPCPLTLPPSRASHRDSTLAHHTPHCTDTTKEISITEVEMYLRPQSRQGLTRLLGLVDCRCITL
jgi:hypothetical protein